jgi:DNA-binding XRE family transcriptional regulator
MMSAATLYQTLPHILKRRVLPFTLLCYSICRCLRRGARGQMGDLIFDILSYMETLDGRLFLQDCATIMAIELGKYRAQMPPRHWYATISAVLSRIGDGFDRESHSESCYV